MKKLLCATLAAAMALSLAGCGSSAGSAQSASPATEAQSASVAAETTAGAKTKTPKYIFLFIGDGMSYPQVQSTNYYLSALENGTSMGGDGAVLQHEDALSFVSFPVAGSAQTYDSTSFCPDSASTATSISTGHKTYSGTINMDETGTVAYETIAEKLKDQLGWKIGVVSSVNLNHATPAAFYCHQVSRGAYYDIGLELIDSGFDYFAGGALLKPTGADKDQTDLYELAADAGYTVVKTQAEAGKVNADTGKVILIDEHLADSDAMAYELDRAEGEWALADYVEKGIECLDNDTGFFLMVEGGKIDWACHANDAASTIADTKALSDAVDQAVKFYNEHPDETLILVTGDHETGGMTIGYAGTNYDTFLQNLASQKISYARYDSDYVAAYKENNTPFEQVLADVQELFGLTTEEAAGQAGEDGVTADSADSHPTGVTSGSLVMTDYELGLLKDAYDKTMSGSGEELTQAEYVLYGSYEPLTVTITHILNNKSGVSFTSYSHTGLPVAVFALGAGQEQFEGYYDNTDLYFSMAGLTGVQ
ncbi:MAG: alkaline phosphatase [Gemmiger sp.]